MEVNHIMLPIALIRSIETNHPQGVNVSYINTRKPPLIVNDKIYYVISTNDTRNMRGSEYYLDYYHSTQSKQEFEEFLRQTPVHLHSIPYKDTNIFEIEDGMHRIERAIWLDLTTIPAEVHD